jgi:protein ImuB
MHARSQPWFAAIVPVRPMPGAAALRRMAERCLRWTPRVHAEHVEGEWPLILLDLRGCLEVHGGAPRLHGRIARAFARRGIEHACCMDACAGAAAARATAHAIELRASGASSVPGASGASGTSGTPGVPSVPGARAGPLTAGAALRVPLDRLAIESIRIGADACAALREVNVRSVGELRAIGRAALADRFGPAVGLRLDQASGARAWDFVPIPHPDPPRGAFEFASPCACPEATARAVRHAIDGLCAALAVRARGVRSLAVRMERAGLPAVRGTVHLGVPTRDAAHLWAVLRPRVERMHLGRHELGQGVERIALVALRTGRVPDGMGALVPGVGTRGMSAAPGGPGPADAARRALGELVDQLAARLGDDAVRRPAT